MGPLALLQEAGRTWESLGVSACIRVHWMHTGALASGHLCPTAGWVHRALQASVARSSPFGWARKVLWGQPGRLHGAAYGRWIWSPVGQVHTCAGWRVLAGSWGPRSGLLLSPDLWERLLVAAGQLRSSTDAARASRMVSEPAEAVLLESRLCSSWERVDALARGGCRWPARPGRCWRGLRVAHGRVCVVFSGSAGSGVSVLTWLRVVGMVSGALTQHPMGQPFAHELKDPLPLRTQVLIFDFGKIISHTFAYMQVIIKPERR